LDARFPQQGVTADGAGQSRGRPARSQSGPRRLQAQRCCLGGLRAVDIEVVPLDRVPTWTGGDPLGKGSAPTGKGRSDACGRRTPHTPRWLPGRCTSALPDGRAARAGCAAPDLDSARLRTAAGRRVPGHADSPHGRRAPPAPSRPSRCPRLPTAPPINQLDLRTRPSSPQPSATATTAPHTTASPPARPGAATPPSPDDIRPPRTRHRRIQEGTGTPPRARLRRGRGLARSQSRT
jgi:hypothetical protein